MICIADLHVAYDRLRVLHGVDLSVPEGRVGAVIGANGAGKTTLLRAVSGLLTPESGTITFEERAIAGWPAEKIAASGLVHVPENRLVFPSLTVRDNLRLGAWVRRRNSSVVAESRDFALGLFPKLAERLDQEAGTLSGGEQQMLAVARGLMARPRAIILDEPSLGLAPRIVAEIFSALSRLRDEHGLTILLVEQNARAAFKVADEVFVMDRGKVVMSGAPDTLIDDPRVQSAYLGGGYHADAETA